MRLVLLTFILVLTDVAGAASTCRHAIHQFDQFNALADLRVLIERERGFLRSSERLAQMQAEYRHDVSGLRTDFDVRGVLSDAHFDMAMRRAVDERIQPEERRRADQRERDLRGHAWHNGQIGVFNSIRAGTFIMGERRSIEVKITLTRDFQMMATETTQFLYRRVVELGHKYLGGEAPQLNPEPSRFIGALRPVENVSYHEIGVWIDLLNQLTKLDAPELYQLFPGHTTEALYDLPTEAQWEFVARARGTIPNEQAYFYSDDVSRLNDYIHQGHETRDVGTLLPLEFEGLQFFDMLGNVREFTKNWYGYSTERIDPVGPRTGTDKVLRGGCYLYGAGGLTLLFKDATDPAAVRPINGFRLIRYPR